MTAPPQLWTPNLQHQKAPDTQNSPSIFTASRTARFSTEPDPAGRGKAFAVGRTACPEEEAPVSTQSLTAEKQRATDAPRSRTRQLPRPTSVAAVAIFGLLKKVSLRPRLQLRTGPTCTGVQRPRRSVGAPHLRLLRVRLRPNKRACAFFPPRMLFGMQVKYDEGDEV